MKSIRYPMIAAWLGLLVASRAHAQGATEASEESEQATQTACAKAYESAQELRFNGELLSAREQLRLCMRDDCHDFMRKACVQWFEEVQAGVPSIVIVARRNGQDLSDVQVFLGDKLLLESLDVNAHEIDPGKYELRFESPDCKPKAVNVVIRLGERNRRIIVEMEPLASPPPPPPPRLRPSPPPEPSYTLPIIFAGVGAAGLAGFASLAILGNSEESRLNESCAPTCTQDQVAKVETRYLLGDISLGVGILGLAAAGYFVFDPVMEEQTAASGWRLDAAASSRGGWARVSHDF